MNYGNIAQQKGFTPQNFSKKNLGGFTLLEVLFSVVTIGILAGISIPIYRSLQLRSDLDLAVNMVVGSLRRAQVLAQASQGGLEWGVEISNGSLTLFQGGSYIARDPSFDELFNISDTITLSGIDEVVFSRLLGDPNVTGDIVLTALSGDTRTVTINPKGSISYDLAVPPVGDWASPVLESGVDIAGNVDGWKVWADGVYAYVVRLGGSPDFTIINIVDSQNPAIVGTLDLPDTPENIFVSGNYAYVASRSNAQELQIVDVSNPFTPYLRGTFDVQGAANARGIYFKNGNVFLVRNSSSDDELVVIDVSDPDIPVLSGSVGLSGTASEVVVLGDYAYVASQSNSRELEVVDVSDPSLPVLTGWIDLAGLSNGNTITGFGNVVVLGRASGEVYLIDVSVPSSPVVLSFLDTGGAVNDLFLGNSNTYLFLVGNNNSADFQVIDISSTAFPVFLGSMDLPANLNGVYYHSSIDQALVVGDNDNSEFSMIAP